MPPQSPPTAIEELLRYDAPVQGFARTVTRDGAIAGQPIAAGETVFMLWATANRDEAAFRDPERVVLDRTPNRHMTFGIGAHRCLGADLARTEIRIMLEQVLRRLPDYRILETDDQEPESIGIVKGRVRLPAVFTPGRRGDGERAWTVSISPRAVVLICLATPYRSIERSCMTDHRSMETTTLSAELDTLAPDGSEIRLDAEPGRRQRRALYPAARWRLAGRSSPHRRRDLVHPRRSGRGLAQARRS